MGKKPVEVEAQSVELESDAWERFERFIKKAAKTPPKHRTNPKRQKPKAK